MTVHRKYFLTFLISGFLMPVFGLQTQSETINEFNALSTATINKASTQSDTENQSDLSAEVTYAARDSIRVDVKKNIIHLYGDAKIKYDDLEMIADYIKIFQNTNIIYASGRLDRGRYIGRPVFKSKDSEPILSDSLYYNIKTQKGKTFNSNSKYDDSYLAGGETKRIDEDNIAIKNVVYSTCDAPDPHFGIFITKGIVGEKNIATGPALLIIEDFITPLAVPFGFFPKNNRKTSGIQFPSVGEDFDRGFYISNLGLYLSFNDYFAYQTSISLWTNGNLTFNNAFNYKKRYRYQGNLNVDFSQVVRETFGNTSNSKDYKFRWQHRLDNKAIPGFTFNVNINYQTSDYNVNSVAGGTYNYNQSEQNSVGSSVNLTKKWEGKTSMSLSFNLNHRQNLARNTISLSPIPSISFNIPSFNPLKKVKSKFIKALFNNPKFRYGISIQNRLPTLKDAEFRQGAFKKKFRTTINHTIPDLLGGNYKILKHINFSYRIPYSENWQLQAYKKYLDEDDNMLKQDTTFQLVRNYRYSFTTSMNTRIYGTKYLKKGFLKAFRHTIEPSFSASYIPNFNKENFPFIDSYIDENGEKQLYSLLSGSDVFGSTEAASLSFRMNNTFEIKLKSKKSEAGMTKPIRIIDNFSTGFNYNFLDKETPMSDIDFRGNIKFTESGKYYISVSGRLDSYEKDESGRETNNLLIAQGKFPILNSISFSINGLSQISLYKLLNKQKEDDSETGRDDRERGPPKDIPYDNIPKPTFQKFKLPWDITFNPSISIGFERMYDKKMLDRTSLNLTVRGSWYLQLTSKWKIAGQYNYDFIKNEIPPLSFMITRDLHCWELQISWTPFGHFRNYHVTIRPKSNILRDLKWEKKRDLYSRF